LGLCARMTHPCFCRCATHLGWTPRWATLPLGWGVRVHFWRAEVLCCSALVASHQWHRARAGVERWNGSGKVGWDGVDREGV